MIAGETGWPFIVQIPSTIDLSKLAAAGAVLMLTDPNGAQQAYTMQVGVTPYVLSGQTYAAGTYVWIPAVAPGQFAIAGKWTRQTYLYMTDGSVRKGKVGYITIDATVAPPANFVAP